MTADERDPATSPSSRGGRESRGASLGLLGMAIFLLIGALVISASPEILYPRRWST